MKKNHVWRTLLTICLATCFAMPAWAEAQIGPAWVDGVSISELSQSTYYTGTMTPQDTTTDGAERPVLVTARSGRKGKSTTTPAAESTTVTTGTASSAESPAPVANASSRSAIETTAATGSATDPSTALQEKLAAEQEETAALATQIAQEEAAASVGTRTGETPIGAVVTEESTKYTKGSSLGIFQITGY